MKKQVILIRWWEAKENFIDFYDYLQNKEYDFDKEKTKRWSKDLWKKLGENYSFFDITMPNTWFADYKAWKIVFEKHMDFFKTEVIFIWHSLWATFLTKYFEENNLKNAKKIILVAPAFKDDINEKLWSFNFDKNLKNLNKIQKQITIFGSKDDFVVKFENIENYMKVLPKSKYIIFKNKGHFLWEKFPEIIKEINK